MYCRKILTSIIFFIFAYSPAFAQFTYEKIKDTFAYEQPKSLTYYSTSRFNRVEALFLNFGLNLKPPKTPGLSLRGDIGYGFHNEKDERWKWLLGVQKDFFVPDRFTIGASFFDEIFTQDKWIISEVENSTHAIFGHNDYMDYVARKGFMGFLDYNLLQIHNLRLEIGSYEYDVLNAQPNSNWSLFAKDDRYASNPHAFPGFTFAGGNETSLRLMAAFDLRDNPIFPIIGWYFEGIFEKTFDDFETSGLFLTAKRFQPTFGNQKIRARLLFGTRSGSFAFQHLMGIGGIGSMRGYESKEFIGNRALFGTMQYNFGGDILQKIPLHKIPFWETLSLGLFYDFGYAWIADPQDTDAGLLDFGDFGLDDLRSNIGFSIIFTEGLLRFDVAKRLDRSGNAWQVYFRILDKF
ncbi:MAG: BamA/TamA family outer membrane protein [bacterium]